MKAHRLMTKIHKWLGLIIGIQVFFWVVGGFIMSSFPLDQVHGDHLRHEQTLPVIDFRKLVPIELLVAETGLEITSSKTLNGVDGPIYELTDIKKTLHFFNALTGKSLDEIDVDKAALIAQHRYTGTAEIESIEKITEKSTEYQKRIPAWKVNFDDSESTSFYITVDTGELTSVRNSMWRIFDFVWMLHIMDYKDRKDFNNWLLIICSFFAIAFAISGIYLVFKRFNRKDFVFIKR